VASFDAIVHTHLCGYVTALKRENYGENNVSESDTMPIKVLAKVVLMSLPRRIVLSSGYLPLSNT